MIAQILEFLSWLLGLIFPRKEDPRPLPEPPVVEDPEIDPPDEPEDEFDDPDYDVEEVTDDDETEREELPDPDPDTLTDWVEPEPPVQVMPEPEEDPNAYQDMIGDVELDDDFFNSFVDLTKKTNVKGSEGNRRRKGTRRHSRLTRIVWHQTAFFWKPYLVLKQMRKWSSHHKINAHVCFDTDGSILLLHAFKYYLWTAHSFNPDCLSFEIMGNFEGILGSGKWYKGDKFGRGRPAGIQLLRCRQMTLWLRNPELGPEDDALPPMLREWRVNCRKYGNPLKYVNPHRMGTNVRNGDCGSEAWYHLGQWAHETVEGMEVGPIRGKGKELPEEWIARPSKPPLPVS